ncbi:zinc-dependent metalloprotease [Amycolatopsis ultiminotia]|uniref:Zinc-dependent metalloprotease n=2 Tax=Amycolatopsis ultiminotia TaxID=543629 RepID=A0ABP6X049_9PSEU
MSQETEIRRRPMVDWDRAATTGALLVRGGPSIARRDAERAVTDLRELTAEAEGHVRELTGLGRDLPLLPGTVVDRPGWVRSAASGLGALTGRALPPAQGGPLGPVLASGAGVQTGLVLAFLASRVLGQYDPFGGPENQGELLLVAPNVVAAERAMKVPDKDFRLWVCLHECTHRLQFSAVPWLRDYFADEVERLVSGIAGDSEEGLSELVGRLTDAVKQRGTGVGIAELLQSPKERAVFDRLLALSTLLEGHADYVMDAVGPRVVPSVEQIRAKFSARRRGGGIFDRLLRALLGLDAKIRQYEEGAKFTKHVVDAVGMDGFNAVWRSPNTLPTRAEIADPAAWVQRLHG